MRILVKVWSLFLTDETGIGLLMDQILVITSSHYQVRSFVMWADPWSGPDCIHASEPPFEGTLHKGG